MIISKAFTPITITLETQEEVNAIKSLCTYYTDHASDRYTIFSKDKLYVFATDLHRSVK